MLKNEATVKVLIFKGTKDWITRRFSDEGYKDFLQELPREDKEAWEESSFLVSSRWPASMYRNMCQALEKLWGTQEPEIVSRAAGEIAIADLSSVFKVVMKLGSPSFVKERFPRVYQHYFNVGELSIMDSSPKSLRVQISGAEAYGVEGCKGVLGWCSAALEYAGAKELKAEHTECIFKAKARCISEFSWT